MCRRSTNRQSIRHLRTPSNVMMMIIEWNTTLCCTTNMLVEETWVSSSTNALDKVPWSVPCTRQSLLQANDFAACQQLEHAPGLHVVFTRHSEHGLPANSNIVVFPHEVGADTTTLWVAWNATSKHYKHLLAHASKGRVVIFAIYAPVVGLRSKRLGTRHDTRST